MDISISANVKMPWGKNTVIVVNIFKYESITKT